MNDITFEQAWNYGGPLMWVLALFSVWALALMIYLWYSQRAGVVVPEAVSRICASKDPESEGGRVADRLMSQVEWLADLGATRRASRHRARHVPGVWGNRLRRFCGRKADGARPGRVAGDRYDDLRPRGGDSVASRVCVLPSPRPASRSGDRGAGHRALRLSSCLTPPTRRGLE